MTFLGQHISFTPLIDPTWLWLLAAICVAISIFGFVMRHRHFWWRPIIMMLGLLVLTGPQIIRQNQTALPDIVLVLVDRSDSQKLGNRMGQTDETIAKIKQEFADDSSVSLQFEDVQGKTDTKMFAALDRTLAATPAERIGAVFMITDGQVHDIPDYLDLKAPLHVLITGSKDEQDRYLEITKSANYAIVGQKARFDIRAVAPDLTDGSPIQVEMIHEDGTAENITMPANRPFQIQVPVDHAGTVISELRIPATENEINTDNNQLILETKGVRDRLRVLMLSGEPHPGERAWRNLLRSDPGVDLVHFTILRPPEKSDDTPINELALIPFPIRDLFEVRLPQFDLIIFDRYKMRGVIPEPYLRKVASYVRRGGAILVVAGPEYLDRGGLSQTIIGDMMPLAVTGNILRQPFIPYLSNTGKIHPVTSSLAQSSRSPEKWGHWYRELETYQKQPDAMTVLYGANQMPLLSLRRVEEGRAAMLASDQMWLWQRGHEGGGPVAELLRRLSHWLMKEPALEENAITTERAQDTGNLVVHWKKIGSAPKFVSITDPGTQKVIRATFKQQTDQSWQAVLSEKSKGLVRIKAYDEKGDIQTALHIDRNIITLEQKNTGSTTSSFSALFARHHGYLGRIEAGLPDFRHIDRDAPWNGKNWAGIIKTQSYHIANRNIFNLLPIGICGLVLAVLCLMGWKREGRS